MSNAFQETLDWSATNDLPEQLELELTVKDRDTLRALVQHAEGHERDEYALEALKIGVLALRHAAGAFDADFIQRETTRLVETLRTQLDDHARSAQDRLTNSFKAYLDPENGQFSQRIRQLTADDGELSRLLRQLVDGEESVVAKTLMSQIGENSPLLKMLSPDQSQGLLALLRTNVEGQLTQQRDHLLKEFSLDNPEGSLRRLVHEITTKHGDFTKHMETKIDAVVKEFSLDEENSALSRLVGNVGSAQEKITQEFSLDNKKSALHRLKEELTSMLTAHMKTNSDFQEEVKISLGKLVTKREEEAKGTRHGLDFEDAVCEFISRASQHVGDIATPTGNTTGMIKNCKVGDCVIELGPDSPTPGSKIVVEAKEDGSYHLAKARQEIEIARKNRGANWGIFIFSKKSAPSGLEPFQRYGHDLVLIWDAEDPNSDVYLKAALITARALCIRSDKHDSVLEADFEAIESAILAIEKSASNLDTIRKSAETIQSSSTKILDRVRKDREALEKQVSTLRDKLGDIKSLSSN